MGKLTDLTERWIKIVKDVDKIDEGKEEKKTAPNVTQNILNLVGDEKLKKLSEGIYDNIELPDFDKIFKPSEEEIVTDVEIEVKDVKDGSSDTQEQDK